MGIKGIYGEIGPGERIALSKLAIEKFEDTGRPLRIAIDVSIWQFQIQAGQGGTNPAIRTFYYRLLRLLSVSVQPLFVFDGPHKPKFKRNKRVGAGCAMVPNLMTKQLLNLFGFPWHMAPGEAEAECALLQKEGIVDAVLSEDVDTLMFGCGTTLRNWSSEGRGNVATHVSLYDSKATKEGRSKLDREGMVLIALMSGGDYITEGIPGCGIKVACEAARAGFGKSLCQIPRADDATFQAWRANLAHEVQTNESKFFRVKHKALQIPEDFPNKEVLGYYTHPVVSSASKIEKLKQEIVWDGEIDIPGLRTFVNDAFDWTNKGGAIKFIRGLAPVLLVHKLRARADRRASGYRDIILTTINEMELVRSICGQREHISTDGIKELRVVYQPLDIVKIDLDAEPDDSADYGRDGLAPVHDDDQMEAYVSDDEASRSASPTKRGPSQYDPTQLDKLWIPRTIAKIGVPLKVEDYEEGLRNPRKAAKKPVKAKAATKKLTARGGMQKGALDQFVTVTKPAGNEVASSSRPPVKSTASALILPPKYLAPSLERLTASQPVLPTPQVSKTRASSRITSTLISTTTTRPKSRTTRGKTTQQPTPSNPNPWTISQSPKTSVFTAPTITKPSISSLSSQYTPKRAQNAIIDLSSSPLSAPHAPHAPPQSQPQPTLFTPRKHTLSPMPPSPRGSEAEEEQQLPELPSTVTRTRGCEALPPAERILTPSSGEKERVDEPSLRKRQSLSSPITLTPSRDVAAADAVARALTFAAPELPNHHQQEGGPAREPLSPSPPRRTKKPSKHKQPIIDISSSPLPLSASQSSSQPRQNPTEVPDDDASSNPEDESPTVAAPSETKENPDKKNKKKFLLLRESIGAFQEVGEEEMLRLKQRHHGTGKGRGRGKERERRVLRYSQVEVLDLTGS